MKHLLPVAVLALLVPAVPVSAQVPPPLSLGAAPAAELPADTNTMETLTPEQARKLVDEFPTFTRQGTTEVDPNCWTVGGPV